jgi:hypothetical protein
MLIRGLLFLLGLCLGLLVFAQDIHIRKIDRPIVIDGQIDEMWNLADSAYDFFQYFPFDTAKAELSTVARVLYDEEYIYVLGVMSNRSNDRAYVTPSLRRDFRGEANDSFTVIFDPFKDHTNGTLFGINPFGVRREGLIVNGGSGRDSFSLDWDNKWKGEAKQYDGYWVAEMAIPFSTLRFAEGQDSWYVNFYRVDSESAERSTWSPIQRNFSIINMATHRTMNWDEPTQKPGMNASVIPFLAANASRDYEEDLSDQGVSIGADLKYAVTPGLNLDITVNPDFSQVEVDQQVTNLDRFEIFFPERRQFFLENADLFSNFGNRGTRPFFTRRIGVAVDTATGQNIQNTIPVGFRLSGKASETLRIGALSMQAAEDAKNGLPAYNFSVLSAQQRIFTRSSINFLVVNKQTFQDKSEFDPLEYSSFNRTLGTDFNLASANNRWNGKLFYHYNISEEKEAGPYATGLNLNYSNYAVTVDVFSQMVGSGYNPEAGFVRRTDIKQLASNVRYRFFPEQGRVQGHGPGFDFDMVGNDTYGLLDWDINLLYDFRFRNTARLNMRPLRLQYTYLFDPFDPSGTDSQELPGDTEYYNFQFIARYSSDFRKKLFYELNTRSGEYFNGYRWNLGGSVGYRYQPKGFASIDFNVNRIVLPSPYASSNLFLVGPRVDLTLRKNFFITTFFQYNSQIENLNINSRLQWRFAPVSDIFIVYTDNYFAYQDDGFISFGGPKVRALTFKMTYWLNL